MTPTERIETALGGGRADRLPIMPIYDIGYMANSVGRDAREYVAGSSADRVTLIEEAFLRHEVDGFFCHIGGTDQFSDTHHVEKLPEYWLVTNRTTGHQWRLLKDGCRVQADGRPIPRAESNHGVSKVQTWKDLETLAPKPMTEEQVEASGRYRPLRHMARKYPSHHFMFQLASPMILALDTCGGYAEGLMLMASEPELFRELLARCADHVCSYIVPAVKAGGRTALFTSYYTGADTISPSIYAKLVLPYELQVCRNAKAAGAHVVDWFLGDLMPVLNQVMELPLDALYLEQGRKGYSTDPVTIRCRVRKDFCIVGFGYEEDYIRFQRANLSRELLRQIQGAGCNGGFIVGTPIMPPDANPEAVEFYFREARRLESTVR